MSVVRNAVIPGAGLGSRLGLGIPKCMLRIGGKPLLGRLIEVLKDQVDLITVVVGYREELVIEYCSSHHPNVIMARNPSYRTTNTAHSLEIGCRHLVGKTVFIDGDLIITPESLTQFLQEASRVETLIGFCKRSTENAVLVDVSSQNSSYTANRFHEEATGDYEWANIFATDPRMLRGASGFVYEHLSPALPTPAYPVEVAEIDTAKDLENAQQFLLKHGL